MPKKYQNRSKEVADAMTDCVFPEDIMLCILTRLPIKSLVRFKSVCKPWHKLFANPKFLKMHQHQFSGDLKNEAFLIYRLSEYEVESMRIFSIESSAKEPTNLDLPYHGSFLAMYSLGCCNGLVCFGFFFLTFDMAVALWNPALSLSKLVRLPDVDFRVTEKISLGFCYDAEGDDFRVVCIVCPRVRNMAVVVEVYSAKSDCWQAIDLAFQFRVLHRTNDAIVNGNPYWVAKDDENESEVLVWCDVTKLEFKMVPLSSLRILNRVSGAAFVDWKGSLAALVCTRNEEWLEFVDVWVFDDGEMTWRKNHTFGPIEMSVKKCLQCSKNGIIMVECLDGKVLAFDPETGQVKEIENEGQQGAFQIYGYNESFAYIEGMQQVVVKK